MALVASSCTTVKIQDHEFCADMGSLGATCAYMFTDQVRDIPFHQWEDERYGKVCESGDAIADLKAALEKLCSLTNSCTYETQKKIRDFFDKIEKIRSRADVRH
jgi:hypothetical protein